MTPTQIEQATEIIARQLDKIANSGPKGIANALNMIASLAAGIIDQSDDRPKAWQYFKDVLEIAEKVGTDISNKLDDGTMGLDDLEQMKKPEGNA